MTIPLTAHIEPFDHVGFLAWINTDKFKVVVQADSVQNAIKELLISVKVKLAYDYGINLNLIEEKEMLSEDELDKFVSTGEKEIRFSLA